MTNLVKLEEAVVLAVLYTLDVPGRFDRFAARLATRNPDWPAWQDKAKLHQEMQQALNRSVIIGRWVRQSSATPPVKEGFGRLDALNRADLSGPAQKSLGTIFSGIGHKLVDCLHSTKTRLPRGAGSEVDCKSSASIRCIPKQL